MIFPYKVKMNGVHYAAGVNTPAAEMPTEPKVEPKIEPLEEAPVVEPVAEVEEVPAVEVKEKETKRKYTRKSK